MGKFKSWGKEFHMGDRVCLEEDRSVEGEVVGFSFEEGEKPKLEIQWDKDVRGSSFGAFTWDEIKNLSRQLTGPIRVGDKLIWEPDIPRARELVEVTEIYVNLDDETYISSLNPASGQVTHNSLDRMREACVRWPADQPWPYDDRVKEVAPKQAPLIKGAKDFLDRKFGASE